MAKAPAKSKSAKMSKRAETSKSAAKPKTAASSRSTQAAGSARTTASRTASKAKSAARSGKPQKGLADLFEHALKDIYYAEKNIYKALPKMIKAAHDPQLKTALTQHREDTAGQIGKLEQVFAALDKKPRGAKCDAIDGILKEGDGLLEDFGGSPAGDAAIIFSCQAVEHYEITRYGSMATYAQALGHTTVADLLYAILEQEKAADDNLSVLGENRVNAAAETGDA